MTIERITAAIQEPKSKRLTILEQSLAKKEAEFDRRIEDHFTDVRSANGQPLNDKRGGSVTVSRWEKQNDALRNLKKSIEVTKSAIDKERDKIINVAQTEIPPFLCEMVKSGELVQWRKHPHFFFVKGVSKGRLRWDAATQTLNYFYLDQVPKDQYAAFRDTVNKALGLSRDFRGATPKATERGKEQRHDE